MDFDYPDVHLRQTLDTLGRWNTAFARSPQFLALNSSQRQQACAVTESFGRYAYDMLGLLPGEWTRDTVRACCTEILPRKVSAEASFFEAISPVLSAFFDFLDSESLLPNARSLGDAVAGLQEAIMERAREERHWAPAKRFVMAAMEAGVDTHDRAALQSFMMVFNLRQFLRTQSADKRTSIRPDWQALASGRAFFRPPEAV